MSQSPPTLALAHRLIDKQGFAGLPEDDFVNHFAADVEPVKAKVMHVVQQPLSATALQDVMGFRPGNRKTLSSSLILKMLMVNVA